MMIPTADRPTRRRTLIFLGALFFALPAIASTTPSLLFALPSGSEPPPIAVPPADEAPLNEELEWRSNAMRDQTGVVHAGAIYLANVFRRQQLNLIPLPPVIGPGLRRLTPGGASYLVPAAWTSRGPQNAGGRTRSLLIDPNNPATMYAGSVSGGIWKSTNAGATWLPQNDFMANLSIMTMAFDPTVANRSVIYAGTGEVSLRGDGIQGAGIFKSTDFGVSWTQLAATSSWLWVPRIAVSSTGAILAAVNKGLYRSTNQGGSWTHTFTSSDAASTPSFGGGLVVAFDPNNSQKAIAAVLDFDFGAGIWRHKIMYSTTSGTAPWTIANVPRLLTSYADHVELAYSPSVSGLVYANVTSAAGADGGEIWKSTDGGQNFQLMTTSGATHCTAGACALWVSPIDSNFIVAGGQVGSAGQGGVSRSTDGGVTVVSIGGPGWGETLSGDVHADQHSIVPAPDFSSSNRKVYLCTDGGIFRTADIATVSIGNGSWADLNATYQTTQYHGAMGNLASHAYIGGTQDDGTLLTSQGSSNASLVAGGDGGLVIIDPTDPTLVYGEFQYLDLFRSRSGGAPNTWNFIGRDGGPKPLTDSGFSFSAAFIGPFVLDARNPNTMLAAGKSVWRSTNVRADVPNWDVIRPSGNGVILSLAQAKRDSGIIWLTEIGRVNAGDAQDGTVARTLNGTASSPTWNIIRTQDSPDGLPDVAATSVYIDPDDSATVYLTFGGYSGHSLWRTRNGNDPTPTWAPVFGTGSVALPPAPARVVVRHPRNSNVLFVGTDVGIYESDDAGVTWSPGPQIGPTDASVYDLKFTYGSDELLLASHGRGLWTASTSSVATFAPTNVVATASGTNSVDVSWNSYPGGTSYQLFKSSNGGAFAQVPGTIATTTYHDTAVVSGRTYLYRVKAVTASGVTDASTIDLATTVQFTNDGSLVNQVVLAAHLQEIQNATNMVLTAAGLPTISFSAVTSMVTPITAAQVLELRNALAQAYYSIGLPMPSFSEQLAVTTTTVKAVHFQELRNLVK